MEYTRVDRTKLKKAILVAKQKLDEADAALNDYLFLLSDKERQSAPKPREGFTKAAPALVRSMEGRKAIAELAPDYDGEAVLEDLENAEALAPLVEKSEALTRRLADTRISWLAEAYVPCLSIYSLAKAAARGDTELRSVIEPMARVFATTRHAKNTREDSGKTS